MKIGDRIKHRRLELEMSQDELARRLGYKSRSSINKIERDASGLPQVKIAAIAEALQTTPSYIMGWDEVDQEEAQKKAGITVDAALRMKTDPDFLSIIKLLIGLDREKMKDVLNLLVVFLK
jgi:transcriptional regulator with XRE-family HTH domain